jgi:2-methylcitrate dehydratase PrpD
MLLRAIADRICATTFEGLPGIAVATAREGILDTIGVTLAGARDDTTAVVTRALRRTAAHGPALIFGHSARLDILSAALINGVASHALDFDDCSNTLGGHPSAPIVPALLAIADGVSGQDFIAAYAAGVETETKLARAVNFHHYEKGWHPTATLGTFGNGLCAALLAQEGMTAKLDALEHRQGFFAVYNGAGTFHPDRILAEWATPYDLADPGIAFKRHPCCGSTHPAADAMLHLRAAHKLEPGRVAQIESWTHPRRLAHTNRPDPQCGLDGKFSIQYVLARSLMHGIVSLEHFGDDTVRDPAVRSLMAKVNSLPDPNAKPDTDNHFYARVRVTTIGGEAFEHFVDMPLGRDRHHPFPTGTLEAKFRDCASMVLRPDCIDDLVAQCARLEMVEDVADLVDDIAAGTIMPAVEVVPSRHACT